MLGHNEKTNLFINNSFEIFSDSNKRYQPALCIFNVSQVSMYQCILFVCLQPLIVFANINEWIALVHFAPKMSIITR